MSASSYRALILIRLVSGLVFFLEGIQKFIYPDTLGVGRFTEIGIPHAAFWGPFVGIVEIVFGFLLIIGLFTRIATVPLLIDMIVAFIYTKWPILISKGFFPMFHDYRTDFAMTLTLIFILINGAGRFSLDAKWRKKESFII